MKEIVSYVRKHGMKAAIATFGLTAVQSAMAAVPTEVSTALTDAKADSLTVAGLALVIVIAIAAFKFMKRAV